MPTSRVGKESGIARKGGSFSRVSGTNKEGFVFDGESTVTAKLQIFVERLKNTGPVMQEIQELFSVMEQERFENGGPAPGFGISETWQEPTSEPYVSKYKQDDRTLVNYGFLESAAIAPRWETVGQKGIRAIIDPRNEQGTFKAYGWMTRNYGYLQQIGNTKDGVQREFVTITPEFTLLVADLIELYLDLGKISKTKGYKDSAKHGERFRKEARHRVSEHHDRNSESVQKEIKTKENSNAGSTQEQMYKDFAKFSHIDQGFSIKEAHKRVSTTNKVLSELQKAGIDIRKSHDELSRKELQLATDIVKKHSEGSFDLHAYKAFQNHLSYLLKFTKSYLSKKADGFTGA